MGQLRFSLTLKAIFKEVFKKFALNRSKVINASNIPTGIRKNCQIY